MKQITKKKKVHTRSEDSNGGKVEPATPGNRPVPRLLHGQALHEDGDGAQRGHDGVGPDAEPHGPAVPAPVREAQQQEPHRRLGRDEVEDADTLAHHLVLHGLGVVRRRSHVGLLLPYAVGRAHRDQGRVGDEQDLPPVNQSTITSISLSRGTCQDVQCRSCVYML